MEKKTEVKTYIVNYYCDKCGNEVKFAGCTELTYPQRYRHYCECGEKYSLDKLYPVVEYK